MPFRMICIHPLVLVAAAVVAIGVITYQILNDKRRRIPVRGRICYKEDDFSPYGLDKPDETPIGFSLNTSEDTEKEKTSNDSCGLRKRTVATQSPNDMSERNENRNHPELFSNSFDENSELSSGSGLQSGYTTNQNDENQKINNISQVNSKQTFVANINDEDSDSDSDSDSTSSESNNSLVSIQNDIRGMNMNDRISTEASCSTTGYENIRNPSPTDKSKEIYKRDVFNYLKTDIDRKSCGEKCFSDEESDVSESNFSIISHDSSTSCSSMKKPMICKGCREDFANAVAYPCKHCYLCLDCAIKVRRVFKKCTICHTVIKTFEEFKM